MERVKNIKNMNAVLFFSVWSSACRHFVTILTCFSTEKNEARQQWKRSGCFTIPDRRLRGYSFYLESILLKPA